MDKSLLAALVLSVALSVGLTTIFPSQLPLECPSLANFTPTDFNDQRGSPKCFCDLDSTNLLGISCLAGATLVDVHNVAQLLSDAKLTDVDNFYISGPIMSEAVLNANTFANLTAINSLTIENCDGPLRIANDSLKRFSSSLTKLSIVSCPFPVGIPTGIAGLSALKELEIISTGLTTLPSRQFSTYTSLRRLDLSSNTIETVEDFAFDGLQQELLELSLSKNHLNDTRQLRSISQLKNLQNLSLSDNEITSVPTESLRHLSQLRRLDLSFNAIEHLNIDSFVGLTNLSDLDLRVNKLTKILFGTFNNLPNLTDLQLGYNSIDKLNLSATNLPKLSRLDLSGNDLTSLKNSTFITVGSALNILDISRNLKLHIIESTAFNGLPVLSSLHLSFANITKFDLNWLIPLKTHLNQLHLDGSAVSNFLHPQMFATLSFQQIFLNASNITQLPNEFFHQSNLSVVDLSHNRWNCDSHLQSLVFWLTTAIENSTVTVNNLDSTRCWLPRSYRKDKLKLVDVTVAQLTHWPKESDTPADDSDDQLDRDEFNSNFLFNTSAISSGSKDLEIFNDTFDVDFTNFTYERLSFKDIFNTVEPSPITLTTTIIAVVVVIIAAMISTIVVVWVTIQYRKELLLITPTPSQNEIENHNNSANGQHVVATTEL